MKYILYGNGASGNHGCEAIIRGTHTILKGKPIVISNSCKEDEEYGINRIAEIFPSTTAKRRHHEYISAILKLKITGNYVPLDGIAYLDTIRKVKPLANWAISVGGDNYCYGDTGIYEYLNKAYHKNGFNTILWGCSIEPDVVKSISKDMNLYNYIVPRESITFNALKEVCENVILAPDPAFFMEMEEIELSEQFAKPVVGINVSPMIISNETKQGITYENYYNLIEWILKETDYNIALIPHVVWKSNDDRTVLKKLYEDFDRNERITLVEDMTAPKLKYIISKCECFIGARTHATIAAYSTCVPTLVIGYSVKARGIARDLFGKEDKYVTPVQSLNSSFQIRDSAVWLMDNKEKIRNNLDKVLHNGYLEKMKKVTQKLEFLSK